MGVAADDGEVQGRVLERCHRVGTRASRDEGLQQRQVAEQRRVVDRCQIKRVHRQRDVAAAREKSVENVFGSTRAREEMT